MHGLWDPEAFQNICEFDQWEKQFLQNAAIERNIGAGAFVPIYVHSDGAPLFDLRVGTTQRPAHFDSGAVATITKRSKPYLFVSRGAMGLSGIEYINGMADESRRFVALAPGRWVVEILEVQPRDGLDKLAAEKVPNFVALINPEPVQPPPYSKTVETFE